MVSDFGWRAQRDADHTRNVQHPTDNEPLDLYTTHGEAGGLTHDEGDRPLTLAERFQAFDESNPHITELLVRLARDWKRRTGRSKLGIAMLWERMRWELSVQTNETP